MPRCFARRDFLVVMFCTSGLLLVINIFAVFNSDVSKAEDSNIPSRKLRENESDTDTDRDDSKVRTTGSDVIQQEVPKDSPTLPWYMRGGLVHPEAVVVNSTGHHQATLFPEAMSGKDRITDQLMFLPPGMEGSASAPLKRILMWNGVSSWGSVRQGRGEFLKQECPVSSCTITTDRDKADQAELVLFKDHFPLPFFQRPPSQIWMIFMLGKNNYLSTF